MSITTLADELYPLVGRQNVLSDDAALRCYGYDAFLVKRSPRLVVCPPDVHSLAAVVRSLARLKVPFVARGAGTGYAGGSIPNNDAVVILTKDLNKIRSINPERRSAWVEAGVITADLAKAVSQHGLRYPPDPSSLTVSTIGGNVATNAGGAHCLGYGVTSNYVLQIEMVLPNGELVHLRRPTPADPGLDLRGLVVGSQGTLGIVTAVEVRLLRAPEHVLTLFAQHPRYESALDAVVRLFTAGIQPEALDMTCGLFDPDDDVTTDGETHLYMDFEGFVERVEDTAHKARDIIEECGGQCEILSQGDLYKRRLDITIRRCRSVVRKSSALRYFLFDAVVPRSQLKQCMKNIESKSRAHKLHVTNTFHVGDGNIHPTPFYDPTINDGDKRIFQFWREVLDDVAQLGGILSGEHGTGLEKLSVMHQFFEKPQLELFAGIKAAFDPQDVCNPGKVVPTDTGPTGFRRQRRLRSSIEVNVVDGYVALPSSATFAEVEKSLQATAWEMPYRPLGIDGHETVVAEFVAGTPSHNERGIGDSRDLLLGANLRSKRGDLMLGSAFAKDVSGFDVRKLVYGSRGQLGDVTHVWLRLTPRPPFRAYYEASVKSLDKLITISKHLHSELLPISSLLAHRAGSEQILSLCLEGNKATINRALQTMDEYLSAEGIRLRPVPNGRALVELSDVIPYELWEVSRSIVTDASDFVAFIGRGLLFINRASAPQISTAPYEPTLARKVNDVFLSV